MEESELTISDEENKELLKLSQPVYFEPISNLTNVFFDQDNLQIFCVRSNGVSFIVILRIFFGYFFISI